MLCLVFLKYSVLAELLWIIMVISVKVVAAVGCWRLTLFAYSITAIHDFYSFLLHVPICLIYMIFHCLGFTLPFLGYKCNDFYILPSLYFPLMLSPSSIYASKHSLYFLLLWCEEFYHHPFCLSYFGFECFGLPYCRYPLSLYVWMYCDSQPQPLSKNTVLTIITVCLPGGYPSPCYQSDRRIQWDSDSKSDVQSAGHQCKQRNLLFPFCFSQLFQVHGALTATLHTLLSLSWPPIFLCAGDASGQHSTHKWCAMQAAGAQACHWQSASLCHLRPLTVSWGKQPNRWHTEWPQQWKHGIHLG